MKDTNGCISINDANGGHARIRLGEPLCRRVQCFESPDIKSDRVGVQLDELHEKGSAEVGRQDRRRPTRKCVYICMC
jgi:hypothetical protein